MKNELVRFKFFSFSWLQKSIWVSLCLIVSGQLLYGQNKTASEYQVKAVFLYNFTQFIDWPLNSFKSSNDPFIIGILGDDPFGSYLDETVAGEKFGTHPIQVHRYHDAQNIANCQMLFINLSDVIAVKKIFVSISDKSILTISDDPNFYKWGGMVRFYTENNKIRLQINAALSKAADLTISSKLLSVAKTNYSKG